MKLLGIIPARYDSTRFPGKPLINLNGKTMIERVYEGVKKSEKITKCINELLPTLNGIPYVEKDSYIKRVQKEETNKTHQLHEAARQRTLNAIELRNKQTGGSRRTNKKNTRVRKTKRRS